MCDLGAEHLSIREEGCNLGTYVEWKGTGAYLDLEQEGGGLDSWASEKKSGFGTLGLKEVSAA